MAYNMKERMRGTEERNRDMFTHLGHAVVNQDHADAL